MPDRLLPRRCLSLFAAAEQQQWNYAPQGIDACANTDYGDAASVFLNRSNATIGSVYTKAVRGEAACPLQRQACSSRCIGPLPPQLQMLLAAGGRY